jgi:hypothetical protein
MAAPDHLLNKGNPTLSRPQQHPPLPLNRLQTEPQLLSLSLSLAVSDLSTTALPPARHKATLSLSINLLDSPLFLVTDSLFNPVQGPRQPRLRRGQQPPGSGLQRGLGSGYPWHARLASRAP